MLDRLGAPHLFVRTPADVAQVDAMILPGGESTTMLKFLKEEDLEQPLVFVGLEPVLCDDLGGDLGGSGVLHQAWLSGLAREFLQRCL